MYVQWEIESPTCGRDTVKATLSLVPENKLTLGTFDVSSAFSQGDTLERDVYVKNPDGLGFWLLTRFHRHVIRLGFKKVPGDPASYSYKDGLIQG